MLRLKQHHAFLIALGVTPNASLNDLEKCLRSASQSQGNLETLNYVVCNRALLTLHHLHILHVPAANTFETNTLANSVPFLVASRLSFQTAADTIGRVIGAKHYGRAPLPGTHR